MTWKILSNYGGPWYAFWLSLSTKCRNLHCSSSLSPVIMSSKSGVTMTLLMLKYNHKEGF